jgi:hypothetical protein
MLSLKAPTGRVPRDTLTKHAVKTSFFSLLVIATLFFLSFTMVKVVYFH